VPRNTAACIGLSAMKIYEQDKDAVMIIETADHVYQDVEAYIRHLRAGIEAAKDNKIILIGIKPTFPHTGFGYIHQGQLLFEQEGINIYRIMEFREKPELKTAKEFLESKEYLWNSGIFISKAETMLNAIRDYMPHLYNSLMKIKDANFEESVIREEFESLESISIDYGVMEKAGNKAVIRGEFSWDDIGDWKAMDRILAKDRQGNVISGEHVGNAENCIIIGSKAMIETDSVHDLIIVDTKDCLLVCAKERHNEVKKIVEMLEKDPNLIKYSQDIQDSFEFNKVSIDCEDLEVNANCLVATIGVDNLYIEKNSKVIIRAL
jgi:mannose-1-phosphate guanylyltransferase